MKTVTNTEVNTQLMCNYFSTLVNQFFKILPMREKDEDSLPVYLVSFQSELLGCKGLMVDLKYDPAFLSLINILQYLIDTPDCSIKETKREVFKAISICNRIKARILKGGADE